MKNFFVDLDRLINEAEFNSNTAKTIDEKKSKKEPIKIELPKEYEEYKKGITPEQLTELIDNKHGEIQNRYKEILDKKYELFEIITIIEEIIGENDVGEIKKTIERIKKDLFS